jgi:hypothetical protein|tara:strand:+ start:646 stop:801 length:156 start_codon:yes stop_codon:yes gene_type:complete
MGNLYAMSCTVIAPFVVPIQKLKEDELKRLQANAKEKAVRLAQGMACPTPP